MKIFKFICIIFCFSTVFASAQNTLYLKKDTLYGYSFNYDRTVLLETRTIRTTPVLNYGFIAPTTEQSFTRMVCTIGISELRKNDPGMLYKAFISGDTIPLGRVIVYSCTSISAINDYAVRAKSGNDVSFRRFSKMSILNSLIIIFIIITHGVVAIFLALMIGMNLLQKDFRELWVYSIIFLVFEFMYVIIMTTEKVNIKMTYGTSLPYVGALIGVVVWYYHKVRYMYQFN